MDVESAYGYAVLAESKRQWGIDSDPDSARGLTTRINEKKDSGVHPGAVARRYDGSPDKPEKFVDPFTGEKSK